LSEDIKKASVSDARPDVGFVACIERGVLERQALLLFESIKLYTGRFRNSAIYALSPRSGYSISDQTRRKLNELQVTYIDAVLNTACPEYGSANRVAAAAYVEQQFPHEILVILDSDTLFLREPNEILLEPDVDVALRPVGVKGMCTSGSSDPFDAYWRDLCLCCGVDYDQIPWTEAFADRCRIKASYNAGLVIVRSELGIMQRWSDFFFTSIRQQLKPYTHDRRFRTGAGWVESGASRLWGSNQAALSLAIWSTTNKVKELEPVYNYQLNVHELIDRRLRKKVFPNLVHVHYHWLLHDQSSENPLFESSGPLSSEQRAWLAASVY
jgi:hypothetical protein